MARIRLWSHDAGAAAAAAAAGGRPAPAKAAAAGQGPGCRGQGRRARAAVIGVNDIGFGANTIRACMRQGWLVLLPSPGLGLQQLLHLQVAIVMWPCSRRRLRPVKRMPVSPVAADPPRPRPSTSINPAGPSRQGVYPCACAHTSLPTLASELCLQGAASAAWEKARELAQAGQFLSFTTAPPPGCSQQLHTTIHRIVHGATRGCTHSKLKQCGEGARWDLGLGHQGYMWIVWVFCEPSRMGSSGSAGSATARMVVSQKQQ